MQEKSGQLALFALTTCILPLITPELMLVRAPPPSQPQTPHDSHPETDDGTRTHAPSHTHTAHNRTRTQYAKVRDGYYSVLCGLFEEAPRSLLSLPAPTYSMLLASLKYALLSYGSSLLLHRTRTTAHTALLTCVWGLFAGRTRMWRVEALRPCAACARTTTTHAPTTRFPLRPRNLSPPKRTRTTTARHAHTTARARTTARHACVCVCMMNDTRACVCRAVGNALRVASRWWPSFCSCCSTTSCSPRRRPSSRLACSRRPATPSSAPSAAIRSAHAAHDTRRSRHDTTLTA